MKVQRPVEVFAGAARNPGNIAFPTTKQLCLLFQRGTWAKEQIWSISFFKLNHSCQQEPVIWTKYVKLGLSHMITVDMKI